MNVDGNTRIIGIIGNPLSHTASPKMHNTVIKKLGLNYIYIPIHHKKEDLEETVRSIRHLNYVGFNVTIPYKETIIPLLDEVDEKARQLGAVNTVINKEGRLYGYNTDGKGFLTSLQTEGAYDIRNKRVCMIGAGGAAKAIAHQLLTNNIASLCIINRNKERAIQMKKELEKIVTQEITCHSLVDPTLNMILERCELIINASSIGMTPNDKKCPFHDFSWANSNQFFYDIVYNPEETMFLKQAHQLKAAHLGGLGMLAGQGCIAFKLFTGKDVSFKLFRDAISVSLS